MKHLKIYEDYNDIESWCKAYISKSYDPREKGDLDYDIVNNEINVDGDVWINPLNHTKHKYIGMFPFQFNRVDGHFTCDHNDLTTLKNAPRYVRGVFNCNFNQLTTLLGGPQYVGSEYHCSNNLLKDFYGFPTRFVGHVYPGGNLVTELLKVIFHREKTSEKRPLEKLILLINEYKVIRNGDTIIEDRFLEALHGIGMNKIPKDFEFKNYKLI